MDLFLLLKGGNKMISKSIDTFTVDTPDQASIYELRGKSTDTKPVDDIPNGSTFYEMDTGKVYMFDLETKLWGEMK